jgi:hypothetical protein
LGTCSVVHWNTTSPAICNLDTANDSIKTTNKLGDDKNFVDLKSPYFFTGVFVQLITSVEHEHLIEWDHHFINSFRFQLQSTSDHFYFILILTQFKLQERERERERERKKEREKERKKERIEENKYDFLPQCVQNSMVPHVDLFLCVLDVL